MRTGPAGIARGTGPAALVVAALALLLAWQPAGGAAKPGHGGGKGGRDSLLRTAITPPRAELRPTVPIAGKRGSKPRSVLSLKLPRLRVGERVRFNGEVTVTTTCVEPLPRCIGRSYGFDPHLRARIVIADRADDAGRRSTVPVSRAVSLTCEQSRPNRNHHCPLTIERGSFKVRKLRRLPCKPQSCRLNMVLDAHHGSARGGEVVVIGADTPSGGVEPGKARLSAVVQRGAIDVAKRSTAKRRTRKLPASFHGGEKVLWSQRLDHVRPGDVLLIRSRQRVAIQSLPYFLASQIVVTTRPNAKEPSHWTRRGISRVGKATEATGFNCTVGHSAFQSPCGWEKAGIAAVQRVPRDARGRPKPLYVNVVARTFPKLAQARGYAPGRLLKDGGLTVTRLRAKGR
jgi:hypothetical protein